jgi:hypothetical protein
VQTIKRLTELAGGAALLLAAAACNPDLNISNPNNPDVARAISTPGDVRNLIGSSYNGAYLGMQGGARPYPAAATSVMADNLTASFGNFGMRFNGQEPRLAYNNNSGADDGRLASDPYDQLYGALGAANDGLAAIKRGIKIQLSATSPDETPQMTALGYLVQGLTTGMVGLTFDKGFILDEDTQLGTATLQPYTNVSAAAVAKYDKAIAAAAGAAWTIPPEFTGGLSLPADRFARMANTLAARQLAYTPRNATENAAVNWGKVLQYAEKGISTGSSPFSLTVEGDGGNIWYDLQKYYGESQSWMRVDQRVIQLMDPSQPVVYTSVTPPPRAQSVDLRLGTTAAAGTDFKYVPTIPFAVARGVYFFSQWQHVRYFFTSFENGTDLLGTLPWVLPAENDLLIAEALVRTGGDKARAATLINKTRVGRGGLTPLTGASSNNDLLAAIFYERDIELMNTGAGQAWFDRRRIDPSLTYDGLPIGNTWAFRGGSGLQKGTPRHLPVPAAELETLGIPVYTYGGNAPNPIFPEQ